MCLLAAIIFLYSPRLTDYDVFPEEYADIYYALEKQVFYNRKRRHSANDYKSPADYEMSLKAA
jgi:transposase InsO family protein